MKKERLISPPRNTLNNLRTPMQSGESAVLELLDSKLPIEWEIYIQPHMNGCRPDFVLLNPNVGIGVIEVKDWDLNKVKYEIDDSGSMTGNTGGSIFKCRSPLEQIKFYKDEIYGLYCPRLGIGSGIAAISAGVIFPFAPEGELAKIFGSKLTSKYEFVVGKETIDSGNIATLFPPSQYHTSKIMNAEHAEDLRSWLIEPEYSAEQREPLIVDADQKNLIDTRTKSGYRRIRGAAGTGKSLVLVSRAAKLASQQKEVLVVSYNITLLNYLRDLCNRTPERGANKITWINFHQLCKRIAFQIDLISEYNKCWREHFEDGVSGFDAIPILLLANSSLFEYGDINKYDAILVDEGQDFEPLWWQVLRKILDPNGEMILVSDITQDIYGTSVRWTDQVMLGAGFSGPWSELLSSYRLPLGMIGIVKNFAEKFIPEDLRQIPRPRSSQIELTLESDLRWVQTSKDKNLDVTINAIMDLITGGGQIKAITDVTVLTENKRYGVEIARRLNSLGIKTTEAFSLDDVAKKDDRSKKLAFWKGREKVKISTLHSYKGWESPVLLISITKADTPKDFAIIYTGFTRLKRSPNSSLTVVCSSSNLESFGAANFDKFQVC